MPSSVQNRLLTSASADTTLQSLLGAAPFRWYFDTLQQGSEYPAIVVSQVSGNVMYGVNCRIKQGFDRYQFTIWGGQYQTGFDALYAVGNALVGFMDTWSGGSGISGLSQYSNLNVLDIEVPYPQKDSPVYRRIMDFMIFSDDTL